MKKILGFLAIGCLCFSITIFAESNLSRIGKKFKSFAEETISKELAGLSEGRMDTLVNNIIKIGIEECREMPDCELPTEEQIAAGKKEIKELILNNPQALKEVTDSIGNIDTEKLIEILKNQDRKETYLILAKRDITLLETALAIYEIDNGFYPSTSQELQALIEKPAPSSQSSTWRGPYMKKLPEDPWENPYHYIYPGIHNNDKFDISSYGPDEIESDDDITNWD